METTDRPIVVGVDGSESSCRALEWAATQAEVTRTPLDVITTWKWPTSYGWEVPLPDNWDPQIDAQRVLDETIAPTRGGHPDVTLRTVVREGHAAEVLVEASRKAALLVVGSRGHGEFAGRLLGSVSQHCVTSAHCPVVVVRDEG